MSKDWSKGSDRAWRKIRKVILSRDNYLCQLKIDGVCKYKADCVHHTLGRRVTGDDPKYLVAACTPCNLHIGDPMASPAHRDPEPRPSTLLD